MNRREWLAGAAATGCSLGAAGPLSARNSLDRCTVVFDSRYSDAVCFSDELIKLGALALDTRSDAAWIARPSLFESPRLIGLTPASDLALLRGCAAQPGLRVVHEALHDARAGQGHLSHRINSVYAAPLASTLTGAPDWAASLARVLATPPSATRTRASAQIMASHPVVPGYPGSLTSWMLVPRVPFPSSGVA